MAKVETIVREGKASVHIIPVGHRIEDQDIYEEVTDLLLNGVIVIPDLRPGDAIRVKEYNNSPNEWYRNEQLYLVDEDAVHPLSVDIDDYGHVPEEFYWPKYPLDYWVDVVEHNTIVPVRFREETLILRNDVKILRLVDGKQKNYIPYVEIDNIMFFTRFKVDNKLDSFKVVDEIYNASHVEVLTREVGGFVDCNAEWSARYDDFDNSKTIAMVMR